MTTKSRYVQSEFQQINVDTTTASGVFIDLLSIPITVEQAGFLESLFTVSASNDFFFGASVDFRLVIDGVPQHSTSIFSGGANVTQSAAIVDRDPITAGAHVIKIQWRCTAGTSYVQPVARPNEQHAALLLNVVLT